MSRRCECHFPKQWQYPNSSERMKRWPTPVVTRWRGSTPHRDATSHLLERLKTGSRQCHVLTRMRGGSWNTPIVGGDENQDNHFGKQFGSFLKNKCTYHVIWTFWIHPMYLPKRNEHICLSKTCTPANMAFLLLVCNHSKLEMTQVLINWRMYK